ncbi:DUF1553 domain-containing protein [Haloferula rosea]|uniref:DUF1553 domain-containing protein n=1 Tax=Haloferula rosea TaxID=490093 RepID=A0A934VAM1_9BACT|nr:DUF1553 domain-containing protein [Haloferula rosea]MBK1826458.1 DUF1553 domain-containing protein [Haloferula rosea]
MRRLSSIGLAAVTVLLSQCNESEPIATLDSATPTAPVPVSAPVEVTFNEHIQPILSEYCYHCHGPDEGTRLPEDEPLRLDLAEGAFAPRENGKPVIIKGDAKASLLVKLLHSTDEDTVMPPPESHKSLNAEQIALLEAWIDQGAEFQDHWAFIPVERPALPEPDSEWSKQPIDQFIEAELAEHQLQPNDDEDPARLYRRLHFDLTGLPPSPEDVTAFEAAAAQGLQQATEAAADRLLATTASAEHFARHWLDAARYADTHGIHIDNYRAIWPYRDWVIEAFKQNMPWDQFTIEQIAGDMLPEPTLDQLVATGFHRCLPTTGEGGAIADEYLAIYAQDRTDTTSAVWLGLTMGCAACHDHKFDPISMKDTYSFNAFFRNTPMSALDRNNAEHPPNIFVPLRQDRTRNEELKTELATAQKELKDRRKAATSDFERWSESAVIEVTNEIDSSLSVHLPLNGDPENLELIVDGESTSKPAKLDQVEAPFGQAKLVSNKAIELGDHASFSRSDQITYGGFIRIEGKPTGAVIARMDPGNKFRGWDFYLQKGAPAGHVIDQWPHAASKIAANKPLAEAKWHHVMITFDGTKSGHQAQAIYIDGKRVPAGVTPNTVGGNIETEVPLRLGSRHNNDSKLQGGKVALQDFRFYRRLLPESEIASLASGTMLQTVLAIPAAQRSDTQKKALYDYYLNSIDEPSRVLRTRINAIQSEQAEIKKRGSVSLIMREKNEEPYAHILNRGVYSDVGEKVTPETPASLPPMPADAPRNRLGLARWLVAKDNPLTARVTMNRLWYQLFGTGIVETVGDFGIMGARPSHPRLLDWLASEFMDSGWDYRHMVKTLVTSRAYRQSAHASPDKLEIDPANRLVSRGPRYRLDAEQIRDLALAGSGLLSGKVGGPPVKPYQPEGIWSAVAMPQSNTRNYKADTGEALYRRSIYTFWKRTAPHPAMEILNAPTREVTCVQREMTNTPLQAFVTLNDPQFVEASRHLAERAIRSHPEFDARADFITQRLLARTLEDSERPFVRQTLDAANQSFSTDPEAAKALISTGETQPDANLDPAELAAWTLVASQILNLDETLNK